LDGGVALFAQIICLSRRNQKQRRKKRNLSINGKKAFFLYYEPSHASILVVWHFVDSHYRNGKFYFFVDSVKANNGIAFDCLSLFSFALS